MMATQVTLHRPSFISLFSGAGGMALGLEHAGLTCVGAAEKDARAAETFEVNFGARVAEPRLLALGPSEGEIERLNFDNWAHRLRAHSK